METYTFETTVQENGAITIPERARWANRRVKVVLVIHPSRGASPGEETERTASVSAFLDTWRGLLKDLDPDQLRAEYLQDKYE